ncbi:hypothetical protein Aca07nite_12350 [Actinoplanes capillaceus]|uniref:SPW repeat-containing protein n=2 Tax=Actinoplanes campanulatus TaxID=113559 RepID=A0ABQ3WDP4_9ACTN|nr:hypothetical protein Aca07nite_12350 [Actinoplanes capillaceus]
MATLGTVARVLEEDYMTGYNAPTDPRPSPTVNAGKLWAGGAATAAVAALIAIAGVLLGRGLFNVDVLAPKGQGVWGDASTGWYALGAALAALAATGLVHVLIITTPRPMRFFGWVMALATVVAMLAPFVTDESLGSRVFTAGLNFVLGVAIGSLVAGTAKTAIVPVPAHPAPRPYPRPYR